MSVFEAIALILILVLAVPVLAYSALIGAVLISTLIEGGIETRKR
jgi:hypothetical protein